MSVGYCLWCTHNDAHTSVQNILHIEFWHILYVHINIRMKRHINAFIIEKIFSCIIIVVTAIIIIIVILKFKHYSVPPLLIKRNIFTIGRFSL